MFDIGWTELLIIAVVAILVVGPKDLPRLLRSLGKYASKLKQTANEFKSQIDDAMRDSELADIRSEVDSLKDMNPVNKIKESIDPLKDAFDLDSNNNAKYDEEDFDDPAAEWDEPDEVETSKAELKWETDRTGDKRSPSDNVETNEADTLETDRQLDDAASGRDSEVEDVQGEEPKQDDGQKRTEPKQVLASGRGA